MSTFGRQSLADRKNNYLEQREFKNKFLFLSISYATLTEFNVRNLP